MTESYPFASIIIPTYNDWSALIKCIESVRCVDYPKTRLEVIIVNNNIESNTPVELELTSNERIVEERKPGSYAARNTGIMQAVGDIIAFIDADCIVSKGWLTAAVELFEEDNDVSRIAGGIEMLLSSPTPTAIELYDSIFNFDQQNSAEKFGYSVTANLIVRRSIFDKVGLFNSELLSGGDTEWGLRAKRLGFTLRYSPKAFVYHPARRNLEELVKKSVRVNGGIYSRNRNSPKVLFRVLLKAMAPPAFAFHKINNDRALSFSQKLKVLAVIVYLKVVRIRTLIGLVLNLSVPARS